MWSKLFIVLAAVFAMGKKPGIDGKSCLDDWRKITIPGEGIVASFYGDIYESLIIGTGNNILKTTDSGTTWKKVAVNVDQVSEFVREKDTLFAISLGKDYFSLDKGDSWHLLTYARIPKVKDEQKVKTARHQVFKLQRSADGELALPMQVLRSSDDEENWENVFPYRHYIASLFADSKGKIYLGIWGAAWNDKNGFVSKNPEDAIIYYLN